MPKLRGLQDDHPDLVAERDGIVASFEAQAEMPGFSFSELFQSNDILTFYRVVISFFIQSSQQLSGINIVSTYAKKILQESFDLGPE